MEGKTNNNLYKNIFNISSDSSSDVLKNNNMNNYKNILKLSSLNNIFLLEQKKNNNNWRIRDKRKLLQEINTKKKEKINLMKKQLKDINKLKINDVKDINNKILSEIETINQLKEHIENENIYNNLKNLTLLTNNTNKKKDSYIEIFSN